MHLNLDFLVALAGLFASVSTVLAQGVTENRYPPGSPPAGCKQTVAGQFEITVVEHALVASRGLPLVQKRRACSSDGILVLTLADSVTTDAQKRTGYVASNYQFQFDAPAQAGALYTAGFSLCENGLLALGNSTQFWKCKSGDFWNLYDRHWADQCDPVALKAIPCGDGADNNGGGNVVGTDMVTTTEIRPISDGQPQVITTVVPVPICQISDGQVQAHTTPCASVPTESGTPVSQITDGQIQVPPAEATAPTTTIIQPVDTGAAATPSYGSTLVTATPSTVGNAPSPTHAPSAPSVLPSDRPVGGGAPGTHAGLMMGGGVAASFLVAVVAGAAMVLL